MKKTLVLITGLSLCLVASPFQIQADTTTAPSPSPAPGAAVGKKHQDINAWLNDHPKIKAKVLAKFDTNHNGVLDGDEIKAFLQWRKERREKKLEETGSKSAGQTSTTTPPAITSPNVQ
jgi:hypothetical protein